MRRAGVALLLMLLLAQHAPTAAAQDEGQPESCRPPVLEMQHLPREFRPGRAYHLLFAIENRNGPPVDAVRATITTTAPGGWTATVAQPEMTLGTDEVRYDVITIAAPPRSTGETHGNLTLLVTFVCTSGEVQTSASESLSLEVRSEAFQAPWPIVLAGFLVLAIGVVILGIRRLRRGVAMTCEAPERLVAAGKSAKFDLHIENRRGRPQRLHLLATGLPAGWNVHLALDEVVLEPGEEKTVWALLKAPPQADAGDEAVVTFRLQSATGGRENATTLVRARVLA